MPWGFLAHPPEWGWGHVWLKCILSWWHGQQQKGISEAYLDFLMPDFKWQPGETVPEILPRPMPYMRVLAHMRGILCHDMMGTSQVSREESRNCGLHSLKATMLSWAQQTQVDVDHRAAQGHHKVESSGTPKMVKLYGRDDVAPMLETQKQVSLKCRQGFVPTIPVERGGKTPIVPKSLVRVDKVLFLQGEVVPGFPEELCASGCVPEMATVEAESDSSSSSSLSESEDDLGKEGQKAGHASSANALGSGPTLPVAPEPEAKEWLFLYNRKYKRLHTAMVCSGEHSENCIWFLDKWFKASCGSRLTLPEGSYELCRDLPAGDFAWCSRKGCAMHWKTG